MKHKYGEEGGSLFKHLIRGWRRHLRSLQHALKIVARGHSGAVSVLRSLLLIFAAAAASGRKSSASVGRGGFGQIGLIDPDDAY